MPRPASALLTFVASLADSRSTLAFDNEGAARLTLQLPQPEAAKVAAKLDSLIDRSFVVALQPYED